MTQIEPCPDCGKYPGTEGHPGRDEMCPDLAAALAPFVAEMERTGAPGMTVDLSGAEPEAIYHTAPEPKAVQ